MSDLMQLWAQDAPPARDISFELAVMARIEQRRFRQSLLRNAVLAAAAGLLLLLAAPVLQSLWGETFAPFASDLVIAALLLTLTLAVPQLYAGQGD